MKKFLLGVFIFVLVFTLLGCSSKKGPIPDNDKPTPDDDPKPMDRYLYALNSRLNQLFIFKINNTTGELEKSPSANTDQEPRCVVVHPDRNHLFVCTNLTNRIYDYIDIFEIDGNNGSVHLIKTIQLQQPNVDPREMVFTLDGKYLCVIHPDKRLFSIYRVDLSNYSLKLVTTINTTYAPKAIAVSSNGYIYLSIEGQNTLADNGKVLIYKISADGSVSNKGEVATEIQPIDIELNKAGTQLYVANFTSRSLMVFAVDESDGLLTHKNTYTGEAGTVRSLAVAPKDDFVFAGSSAFGINAYAANGSELTLIEGSPFDDQATAAYSLAVDPSGRFLYVGQGYSGEYARVDAYTIEATGGLTLINIYQAGGTWVTIR